MSDVGNRLGLPRQFVTVLEVAFVPDAIADVLQDAEDADRLALLVGDLDREFADMAEFTRFQHQPVFAIQGMIAPQVLPGLPERLEVIGMHLPNHAIEAAMRLENLGRRHVVNTRVFLGTGQQAIELVTPFVMTDMCDQLGFVEQCLVLAES